MVARCCRSPRTRRRASACTTTSRHHQPFYPRPSCTPAHTNARALGDGYVRGPARSVVPSSGVVPRRHHRRDAPPPTPPPRGVAPPAGTSPRSAPCCVSLGPRWGRRSKRSASRPTTSCARRRSALPRWRPRPRPRPRSRDRRRERRRGCGVGRGERETKHTTQNLILTATAVRNYSGCSITHACTFQCRALSRSRQNLSHQHPFACAHCNTSRCPAFAA